MKRRPLLLATSVVVLAAMAASATPALAGQNQSKRRSARTVAIWTLTGAAAGTGLGFLLGFRAYEDAPFAERKIGIATLAGGAVGTGLGLATGIARSRASGADSPAITALSPATPALSSTEIDSLAAGVKLGLAIGR
jgi:hypothetical protein